MPSNTHAFSTIIATEARAMEEDTLYGISLHKVNLVFAEKAEISWLGLGLHGSFRVL
jgi:hypothetical protein